MSPQNHGSINSIEYPNLAGYSDHMIIKPIRDLLKEEHLEYPCLSVLQSNESLYTALLVQPEAHIQVRDEFIRNADRAGAYAMYDAIAREASTQSVELLVTPEYSFPWETIEALLQDDISPDIGQLWVLGCESLSLKDLPTLKERFSQWAKVLHEPLPEQPATARYLDPLVYIFRTETSETHESRLVMVVQFKTTPSGDRSNIEATCMARGNDVYLFESGNEVRLITIICSDAFEFTDKIVKANYENLLLLHIQLNESPRHEPYMRYRRLLYDFPCDQTELICLNWAEKFCFDIKDNSPILKMSNISESSWHSKSSKFATEDAHIEQNHRFGLYYTRDVEQHRHMLHFTYKPAAFLLQATQTRHHGVEAARSRRRGPELTHTYHWDIATTRWVNAAHPVDDGFVAMTNTYGGSATVLNNSHTTSPLATERLACISSGDFGPMKNWHAVNQLPTMNLEPRTEVMKRITVTQDPAGNPFRDKCIRTIKTLATIPAKDLPLPSRLEDLKNGYSFEWHPDTPNCNVISTARNLRATLIYAGEDILEADLNTLHARASATVANSSHSDFVCLLYRDGPDIKRYDPPLTRSITQASTYTGKNFMEPEL